MTEPLGTDGNVQDPAQTTGGAPWSAELDARFEDPATRQAVDAYMRENVQPYVTNLEQSAKPALELYQDLQANPGATYLELTTDLFGDDAAKAITEILEQQYGDESEVEPANLAAQPTPTEGAITDPRLKEMLSDWEENRNEKLYEQELARLQTANPTVPIKDALFRPFVVAEDGDMTKAFEGYQAFLQTARAELFKDLSPDAVEVAPPALGTGNQAGGTPPPTEKQYDSLGDAIQAWADEQSSQGQSAAPPHPGQS